VNRRTVQRVLGGVAVAGPLACAAAWAFASLSAPGYHPMRADLSALAAAGAPRPWITMTGELLLAAGILALAARLVGTLTGREAAAGIALLATTGVAVAVQALAREDCDTGLAVCMAREQAGTVSWHHQLHNLAAVLSFMTFLAAPAILAVPLRAAAHRHALATYSTLTTVAGVILLVGYVAAPAGWNGLAQRVFVAVPVAWTVVLGTGLRRELQVGAARSNSP
jgi:hypothetical membrane protein